MKKATFEQLLKEAEQEQKEGQNFWEIIGRLEFKIIGYKLNVNGDQLGKLITCCIYRSFEEQI